jgi:tyrosinase
MMFFSKKQSYISLDDSDEEVKVGGTRLPAVMHTTVEIGLRWLLAVSVLLCLSIVSAWALFFQNLSQWNAISSLSELTVVSSACVSPPVSSISESTCVSPPIRREWRTLSTAAKKEYVEAVQCLATKPSLFRDDGSLYDDFPWVHQQTAPSAHVAASFFPWHRYYIHVYEQALKNDCGYKGQLPYWDWSADWKDFANAPVWDNERGFGGNGDPSAQISVGEGRCVTNGPFAGLKAMFYGESYEPHCLSRGFQTGAELEELSDLIRPDVIEDIMQKKDFSAFSEALEKNAHHFISGSIRGDFAKYTGPYDPVFFLHHANLDRLWWNWQQEDPENRLLAYNGQTPKDATFPSVQLADMLDVGGLSWKVSVKEVMETNKGLFCYQY